MGIRVTLRIAEETVDCSKGARGWGGLLHADSVNCHEHGGIDCTTVKKEDSRDFLNECFGCSVKRGCVWVRVWCWMSALGLSIFGWDIDDWGLGSFLVAVSESFEGFFYVPWDGDGDGFGLDVVSDCEANVFLCKVSILFNFV